MHEIAAMRQLTRFAMLDHIPISDCDKEEICQSMISQDVDTGGNGYRSRQSLPEVPCYGFFMRNRFIEDFQSKDNLGNRMEEKYPSAAEIWTMDK